MLTKEMEMDHMLYSLKALEIRMQDIQKELYFGYDKPSHTGSFDHKMIKLNHILASYTNLAIQKNDIEKKMKLRSKK
jgi:hypothetical protein